MCIIHFCRLLSRKWINFCYVCNDFFCHIVDHNSKQGSKHWMVERVVAVGLLAAVPAAICYPTPLVDHCLAVLLPLHAYW